MIAEATSCLIQERWVDFFFFKLLPVSERVSPIGWVNKCTPGPLHLWIEVYFINLCSFFSPLWWRRDSAVNNFEFSLSVKIRKRKTELIPVTRLRGWTIIDNRFWKSISAAKYYKTNYLREFCNICQNSVTWLVV